MPAPFSRRLLLASSAAVLPAGGALIAAGQPAAGCALMVAVHSAGFWATLHPYCTWWGPQRLGFAASGPDIWLTFDDGPDPADTPWVLEALAAAGARAGFFFIGTKAQAHPGLVRAAAAAGHAIGSHTLTHPQASWWALGPRATEREVRGGAEAVAAALGGPAPRLFRAPVGMHNPFLHPVLDRLGLELTGWTVRARDGAPGVSPSGAATRLLRGARPGAVLLLHEGRATGGGRRMLRESLPRVLDGLHERGLRCVLPPGV